MAQAKIALIGGTGFIGRHLLESLRPDEIDRVRVLVYGAVPEWLSVMRGAQVVRGDLLKAPSLAPLLEGAHVVVNLAGQVSPEADDYQRVNLAGMVKLAKACLSHRVRRVIHASSALVYGDALGATEETPCRPITPYATLKLAAEETLKGLLATRAGLLCLRLSNVYGPRQSKGLMPYLVDRIRNRQPITIDADGAQIRDFVHVRDVAGAFVKAIRREPPLYADAGEPEILNIGSGVPTSVMTLVRLLEDVLEVPATGRYRPEHTGGERRNTVDVSKAAALLDWKAAIGLPEGAQELAGGDRAPLGSSTARAGEGVLA